MPPGEPNISHTGYNPIMSVSPGLTRRFRQLRWRLTLTYTAVTVGALLVVELIAMLASGSYLINLLDRGYLPPRVIEAAMTDYLPMLRHFLEQDPPDQEGLAIWLGRFYSSTTLLQGAGGVPVVLDPGELELLMLDSDGVLMGTSTPMKGESLKIGSPLSSSPVPQALSDLFQVAQSGEMDPKNLFAFDDDGKVLFVALPVWDSGQQRLLGVLIISGALPSLGTVFGGQLDTIGVSLLFFTLFAGLIGTLFGSLATRGLVKRLDRMAEVTRSWSLGKFGVFIDDPVHDELGELSDRLNQMAGQLQQLLETRREFAILEERTRIARELHDSAKQQAFAAAGQVNAARELLKRDPEGAQAHIDEAENLIRNLRRELGNLIRQLRPVELEGKGLTVALQDYLGDWSRQTGIKQELRVRQDRRLPLEIEQAVFRIIQEALANVARHSNASGVEIKVVSSGRDVVCTLQDDGVGFDPNQKHNGFGLRSMRERAGVLGGTLQIESALGSGTSLTVRIPFSQRDTDDKESPDG